MEARRGINEPAEKSAIEFKSGTRKRINPFVAEERRGTINLADTG